MRIVTVIISARNAAPWLPQCLESVARQALPCGWRVRILLGIDACAETLALASTLYFPNLAVRFFPEHVGPYVIFNSLANSDRSEVLVRFDADDVMLDGYLWMQLEMLDSRLTPTVTQTWSIYVDPEGRPLALPLADGKSTYSDGRRPSPSDGQFLLTRAVLKRLGGFHAWWCHADTEFLRRATWSGVARLTVPHYLYLRRVHANSITQSATIGYYSSVRQHYAAQIAHATERYARGEAPEWVRPIAARYYPPIPL